MLEEWWCKNRGERGRRNMRERWLAPQEEKDVGGLERYVG